MEMWSIVPWQVFSAVYSKASVAYCGFCIYCIWNLFVVPSFCLWRLLKVDCPCNLAEELIKFNLLCIREWICWVFLNCPLLFVVWGLFFFLMPSVLSGHENSFCTFLESISMLCFLYPTQWLFAVESCSLVLFLTLKGQQELAFY